MSQGQKFRAAISAAAPTPLQIPGTINAYTALMAERVGHQAIYLSGGGVANASYGLPDLGMTFWKTSDGLPAQQICRYWSILTPAGGALSTLLRLCGT